MVCYVMLWYAMVCYGHSSMVWYAMRLEYAMLGHGNVVCCMHRNGYGVPWHSRLLVWHGTNIALARVCRWLGPNTVVI